MSKTPPLILKEGIALKVLESERLRTFKLVGIECLILVHSRNSVFEHKKSNFVIFRPRQKNMPLIPRIRILDSVTNTYANLEIKDYVKYLGLMIDSNLLWKYHIESICHKISKSKRRVVLYFQFTTHSLSLI